MKLSPTRMAIEPRSGPSQPVPNDVDTERADAVGGVGMKGTIPPPSRSHTRSSLCSIRAGEKRPSLEPSDVSKTTEDTRANDVARVSTMGRLGLRRWRPSCGMPGCDRRECDVSTRAGADDSELLDDPRSSKPSVHLRASRTRTAESTSASIASERGR